MRAGLARTRWPGSSPPRPGQFDLVVFDEASQIRVADAVGALGRARAAVVVGDSKQMPPTSFAEPSLRRRRARGDFPETVGRGRGVDPQRVRAGAGAAAVAVVALPQPGRVADRVQQRPVLREPAVVVPRADPRAGLRRSPTAAASRWCGCRARSTARGAGGCCAPTRSRRRRSWRRSAGGSTSCRSTATGRTSSRRSASSPSTPSSAPTSRRCCATPTTTGWPPRWTAPTARACSSRTWRTCRATSATSSSSPPASPPTPAASLPLNFGPLNRAGGERRLNVAITRARRQVVVFSSFDPEQLRAEETSSVGIKHLRAYLDLAALGTDVLPRDARSAAVHRPAPGGDRGGAAGARAGRCAPTSGCRSSGSTCRSLDRSTPTTPVMAVLLDGPAWARAPDGRRPGRAAGRGAGRDAALAGGASGCGCRRGWPTPAPSLDQLVAAVDTVPADGAGGGPVHVIPLPDGGDRVVQGRRGAAVGGDARWRCRPPAAAGHARAVPRKPAGPVALDGETQFVPWIPKAAGEKAVLDELPASKAARVVRRVLTAGIKAEGPIHVDRLAKLTVGAFGLNRVGRVAQGGAAVAAAAVGGGGRLPVARRASTPRRGPASAGRCRAPTGRWSTWRRRSWPTRWRRCAGPAAGMRRDELLTQTAAVFGYKRRTPTVTPLLEAALDVGAGARPARRAALGPADRLSADRQRRRLFPAAGGDEVAAGSGTRTGASARICRWRSASSRR